MPAVAATASWLESLKLPMREVNRRYTRSELGIMAWRSGEIASNMHSNYQNDRNNAASNALNAAKVLSTSAFDEKVRELEGRLGPELCEKLEGNEDVDLRQLTGPEVFRFMRAQGIKVNPGITRAGTSGSGDPAYAKTKRR